MLINKRTGFHVADKEKIEQLKNELVDFDTTEYLFVFPSNITDNTNKSIYKVGFLKMFYSIVFPDMTNTKIFKKINEDWQVFVGVRQMERYCKRYETRDYKRGN